MKPSSFASFDPRQHAAQLVPLITELEQAKSLERPRYDRILRRYPRAGKGAFSKSEIIRGVRRLAATLGWDEPRQEEFVERLKRKPVRTQSGVAPVSVLTRPHPCPGKCIFCPSDVRMPKSYLSREPGAQRAAQHDFDPYGQTLGRLLALHHLGHRVDKVELIVLGGTWSFYPLAYQIGFIKRCLEAMNDFASQRDRADAGSIRGRLRFAELVGDVVGREAGRTYNQRVSSFLSEQLEGQLRDGQLLEPSEGAEWAELEEVQRQNETAAVRCVGMVLETRPDHISAAEVVHLRRLGCTKVQIGYQSLADDVLRANRRGHDVAATRRAMGLLRRAGFKIHAHWMANLHGSDPRRDVEDFKRIFADPDFRPDELKIYPCSLIESAELMRYWQRGDWRPYDRAELLKVLTRCMLLVPPWCRVTRVIRDIPGDDIWAGNRVTNFRQVLEQELARRGLASRDIRAREIGRRQLGAEQPRLEVLRYDTSNSQEIFLQMTTAEGWLLGFCRLALPGEGSFIEEIRHSALLRELHVYGVMVGLGEQQGGRAQHLGLGRRLVAKARELAAAEGFLDLAVISSIGTRPYYRTLGFVDGELYQHLALAEKRLLPQCGVIDSSDNGTARASRSVPTLA